MKRRYLAAAITLFVLAGVSTATWAASAPLAVTRGQKSVDPSTLPFVGLRVTLDGAAMNIQKIVFEDLAQHKQVSSMLAKTFDHKHPDYLTAIQGKSRSAILAILRMKAGRYRLRSIEYNPAIARPGIGSVTIDLAGRESYEFTVEPGCVNYVGALVIAAAWRTIRLPAAEGGGSAEASFQARLTVEPTSEQDRKWAGDMVPGMRDLPYRSTTLVAR